jgi:hypothetical protein
MNKALLYTFAGMLLPFSLACQGNNRNPEILSFNGVEPDTLFGIDLFQRPFFFKPGTSVSIEVEAEDPDGDPIQIWFSHQPPGLVFDPDENTGVWEVPEDYDEESIIFNLIVSDDFDPQGVASIFVPFWNTNGSFFLEDQGR